MSRPDLEEERYLGLDAEFADLPLQRLWCRHVQRLPLRNSEPDVRPVRRLMRRHHSPASRPYETDPRDAQKYSSRRAHRAISAVGCKSPKRRAPTSRYGRQRGFGRETPLPVGDSGIGCARRSSENPTARTTTWPSRNASWAWVARRETLCPSETVVVRRARNGVVRLNMPSIRQPVSTVRPDRTA